MSVNYLGKDSEKIGTMLPWYTHTFAESLTLLFYMPFTFVA